MKPIPTARQAASVPPTVVAPTALLDERGGEVARPDLACLRRRSATSSSSVSPTRSSAVEDADRRRHRARVPDAALALEPDRDALAGRKPVRDERRLERDDGPPLRQRLPDLVRDADQVLHGMEPSFATHRAAAASASSGPPTR